MKTLNGSDFSRFCKSLIIIALGVCVADFTIGQGLRYLYKKQSSGPLYLASYSLDSTKADFLVFGSSKANHHYDSKVFEEKLKSTFYNCGRDAQGAIYSMAMISGVIERYAPKCIILDIRPEEFTTSDVGNISALFPYSDNKNIQSYYHYNGPFENIKLFSSTYPYNSLLTTMLVGITSFNKKRINDYKGYVPLKGSKQERYTIIKESNPIDTTKVRYFKELLMKLDRYSIPTYVVISPTYGKVIDGATAKLARDICSKFKKVRFLNFAHGQICKESQYFYDGIHLNENGAKIFSNELAKHISTDVE